MIMASICGDVTILLLVDKRWKGAVIDWVRKLRGQS
jgi:hypothetical protein